ncbi:MAG TPA: fibronectin type III domain-containing protein [Candidatus Polarisedimenticolaceae bacterium]
MAVFIAAAWAVAAQAAPDRDVRASRLDLRGSLPADLVQPEGKSRWDLTGVPRAGDTRRTLTFGPGSVERTIDGAITKWTSVDPADAALRWFAPDRTASLKPGTRETLEIESAGERLVVETSVVGIGWVHLPSGPRETVLQRALVLSRPAGVAGFRPASLVYRWVDPRAGVVAEVESTASADGKTALEAKGGFVAEEILAGAADLKIYVDQLYKPSNVDLNWGFDRGAVPVSSLTPEAYPTIGDLINANSWDFSQNTSGTFDVAQLQVPLNAQESCNAANSQCGYTDPTADLGRQDKYNSSNTLVRKDNQVTQRENRATDVTIWSRAGAQKEGTPGAFGSGETRYCYVSTSGRTRNPVPLWRFPHQDAGGWYMQAGDAWSGGPTSSCQQTLFNCTCGDCGGLFQQLYSRSCSGFAGTQGGTILKGGVVTTPSGHTFNALLVRTVGEFCVYSDSGCIFKFDEVRTVVYTWQSPYVGTLVLLQSPQLVPNFTSWTTTENTSIAYGLYPPVSIAANASTDTTVSLSWNPGNDTHRIARYKIYWDTDSGATTPYAFDSDANAGQVSFVGTTATISGLTPGTTYHFTVTSIANYTDPSSGLNRTYESIKYPTQVAGDPSFLYPVEVQRATTGGSCVPAAAVTGVVVNKSGTDVQVCWNPTADTCATGYDVLGAASPTSPANFTTVGQTVGLETCWTGNPASTYLKVVARGPGGQGP